MPIQRFNAPAQLTALGRFRKGGEKQTYNGKQTFGKDLDYLRFTSEVPGIVADVQKAYGDKPGTPTNPLHIMLVGQTLDECFPQAFNIYAGAICKRWCDSVRIYRERDPQTGRVVGADRPCEAPKCACKAKATLRFLLPKVERIGVFELGTTSVVDIQNINAVLNWLAGFTSTVNAFLNNNNATDLSMARLILYRVPTKINYIDAKDNYKPKSITKNLLKVEIDSDWVGRIMKERTVLRDRLLNAPGNTVPLMLPSAEAVADLDDEPDEVLNHAVAAAESATTFSEPHGDDVIDGDAAQVPDAPIQGSEDQAARPAMWPEADRAEMDKIITAKDNSVYADAAKARAAAAKAKMLADRNGIEIGKFNKDAAPLAVIKQIIAAYLDIHSPSSASSTSSPSPTGTGE